MWLNQTRRWRLTAFRSFPKPATSRRVFVHLLPGSLLFHHGDQSVAPSTAEKVSTFPTPHNLEQTVIIVIIRSCLAVSVRVAVPQ